VKRLALILPACLALAVAGCGSSSDSSTASSEATASTSSESSASESSSTAKKTKPKVTVPKGAPPKKLEIREIEKGSGAAAKAGDEVSVQYVGVGYGSGKEFDSSWSRGAEPFTFGLGAGQVIPGWDQGVQGMKVGGRRELIIPPNLAYGPEGTAGIGPNETLIFVIDLLAVK
jgi:peptidylprolyl isomerase